MNFANRYTPYFVSAILPLLTFSWLIPKGVVQIDLWLLWLVAMLFLGLPMMFLEFALAKRSGASVWQGMQSLTRESDAPTYWRIFALLSVVLALVLGAGFIARFGEFLSASELVKSIAPIPSYGFGFVLAIIALILSPLKHKPLWIGLGLVLGAGLVSLISGQVSFAMTKSDFGEWALAVVLALFSMGLGTGLYWFLDNTVSPKIDNISKTDGKALSSTVLPVWLAQLVFGMAAFTLSSAHYTPIMGIVAVAGTLLIVSFLLNYAMVQLKARFGMILGIAFTSILILLLSALPSTLLTYLLVVVGLLTVISLSLFAGFAMKASHLRKSLNFKNEFRYNLWRIAVRWLVPLAVISALIGWFVK